MTERASNEWVILEAMGHSRVAGQYLFENGLHRVDIPDTSPGAPPDRFVRTERYGQASIFRITSVSEETARLIARQCVIPEAIPWDARRELAALVGPGESVEGLPALRGAGMMYEDDTADYEDEERY